MKPSILLCLLWLAIASGAQVPCVYRNAAEFAAAERCGTGCGIRANSLLHPGSVYARCGRQWVRYAKDSIYGYCTGGRVYRCYQGTDYLLEEKGRLMIWSREVPVYGDKYGAKQRTCYFSTGADAGIAPLSLIDLKQAFPFDTTLHHYLDLFFSDDNLCTYDTAAKQYAINQLFEILTNK